MLLGIWLYLQLVHDSMGSCPVTVFIFLIVRRHEAGTFWSGENFRTVCSLLGTGAHLASHHDLTHIVCTHGRATSTGNLKDVTPRGRVGLHIGGSGASIVINLSKVDFSAM